MGTNLATYRRVRRLYHSLTPAQRVGMTPERLAYLAANPQLAPNQQEI